MFAARTATRALTRQATVTTQRRSNLTVPRLGTQAEMEAEAVAQLRARVRRQKEIMESTGHSEQEEFAEMIKWIKISAVVAAPVCVLSVLKDLLFVGHVHRPEGDMPDYMNIQVKEFPWECETCALFDLECWKKCRAEQAGN